MKTVFLIFFIFQFPIAQGQIDHHFIKHLNQNHLKKEHWTYLQSISNTTDRDSIAYLKAKYFIEYPNDSIFHCFFQKSKSLIINDRCAFNLANILFLKSPEPIRSNWYNSLSEENLDSISNKLYAVYFAGVNPLNYNENKFPESIQMDLKKYRKAYCKKPFLSAALSTVVPGLGKLYAGRKNSFLMTFFSHIIYGVQSYEAVHKLGIRHPFSIFSLGFFSIFYIANIYGSYHHVNEVKKELREQLFINASDYYNINCSCNLY